MATTHRSTPLRHGFQPPALLVTIVQEWLLLVDAILHPARLVAEVEEVRALLVQADAVEASDPARAARLRRRAAGIGMR